MRQLQFQGFWWRLSSLRLARGMKDTLEIIQCYKVSVCILLTWVTELIWLLSRESHSSWARPSRAGWCQVRVFISDTKQSCDKAVFFRV